jgi:hypothetical protein
MVYYIIQNASSLRKVCVLQTVSDVQFINARCTHVEILQFTSVQNKLFGNNTRYTKVNIEKF